MKLNTFIGVQSEWAYLHDGHDDVKFTDYIPSGRFLRASPYFPDVELAFFLKLTNVDEVIVKAKLGTTSNARLLLAHWPLFLLRVLNHVDLRQPTLTYLAEITS